MGTAMIIGILLICGVSFFLGKGFWVIVGLLILVVIIVGIIYTLVYKVISDEAADKFVSAAIKIGAVAILILGIVGWLVSCDMLWGSGGGLDFDGDGSDEYFYNPD